METRAEEITRGITALGNGALMTGAETETDHQTRMTATAEVSMTTLKNGQQAAKSCAPRSDPSSTPGTGILHLSSPSPRSHFTTSRASYPLKLLSPTPLPSQPQHLALAYTLAYGGGLVAGDIIRLAITLDAGAGLVLLTQGSTKVYKGRPGLRPMSYVHHCSEDSTTRQNMHVKLERDCFALVLPDSVSAFRASQYAQRQRFVLPSDASSSVLILDWVNSGRGQPGSLVDRAKVAGMAPLSQYPEIWSMESYTSTNEVFVGEKMIMRDKMKLGNPPETVSKTATDPSPTAIQLAPYHVYATVLIYGPHLAPLLAHLRLITDKTTQFQQHVPPTTTWSYSDVPCQGDLGGILRVAGTSVQDVRTWLRGAFLHGGIKHLVGDGLWPRVI